MTFLIRLAILITVVVLSGCNSSEGNEVGRQNILPKAVEKTNAMKVYMHYMPWFQGKDFSGYWGSHWKMKTKNPDVVDESGKREIASHYYPLIGPYDSQDRDVIDYHLLLMKYTGVDGVLVDWYGSHNVYDYKVNLLGTNALVDRVDDVGLGFALVYEEFTAENVGKQTSKTAIEAAQTDMLYAEINYFSRDAYITISDNPLLLTFGPRYFKQGSQWDNIFSKLSNRPTFLPLWNHAGYTGNNDSGEFSWVDFTPALSDLDNFYNRVLGGNVLIGSAFPRFHDFYEEGGTGTSYGFVDFEAGNTLRNTLAKASQRKAKYLQLVTWNDFGEGTVIEPTSEDGFLCLEIIQEFTGVPYSKHELDLIHNYYLKKKKYRGDATIESQLTEVFDHLVNLEVAQAEDMLNSIP